MQLDRYLDRIHRRWIFIRAAERVGISILISCVVAMALAIVLMMRGEAALGVVEFSLAIGLLVGGLIGWMTKPSLLDTAIEVDRQLNLADLLATALSIRREQASLTDAIDQQWHATILSLAEARCAAIADESLMLRKFGFRAWGGIGLAAAMLITLGLLSTNPLVLHAHNPNPAGPNEDAAHPAPQSTIASAGERFTDPRDSDPESADRSKMDGQERHNTRAESAATSAPPHADSSNGDHGGAGKARTTETPNPNPPLAGVRDSRSQSTDHGATVATGGGPTDRGQSIHQDSESGLANPGTPNAAAPPWTTQSWPAAQQRAAEQIQNGEIPDAYRDLVRDYFAR